MYSSIIHKNKFGTVDTHSIIGALPFRAQTAPIWESAPIIDCLLYLSNTRENKNNIKGMTY